MKSAFQFHKVRLKEKPRYTRESRERVSIPQGTIKSSWCQERKYRGSYVSIPQGTIKSREERGRSLIETEFQFHKVRLKAT